MIDYSPIRVLEFDIETAPNLAYLWGFFNQNVAVNQIVEVGYTLCWAARWEGDSEVLFAGVHTHSMQDMLQQMWDLLDEADVVIHYNGKKFDVPTLNKEFVKHGMPPPSPYQQIDLFHVVRREFRFERNGMDFVCEQLGIPGKIQHKGMELWDECMDTLKFQEKGIEMPEYVEKAWRLMKRYNVQDVKMLRHLYKRLLPWIKNHPNRALWMPPSDKPKCPNCGSTKLRFKSYKQSLTLTYKQYQCKNCGSYPRERYAEKTGRKDVLRGQ